MHDVWPSPGTVPYVYISGALAPDGILPGAKFTLSQILAFSYNLSGYIFATKACIDNRKKRFRQQYLFHMSSQYGELQPTNG